MKLINPESLVRPARQLVRPALSLVRSALRALGSYRHHQRCVKQAKRILNNIEGVKGPLPHSIVKQCDDYAKDVFGHHHFSAWLYVYSATAGCFKEGWIPDNYWGSVVVPKLKGNYGTIARLKALHSTIFSHDSFPDILSYVNGVFFDAEYRVLHPDSIKGKLFANQNRVVFKLDNSLQGRGIFFFDRESFDLSKIHNLGNGIFQEFIKQHEVFQEFASESVATLRMTTVTEDDGTTSLRACYLRLGTGADTHVQSKSHIRVPIDIKSGAFNNVGFTPDWLEVDCHPTSKVKFHGRVVPAYDDCLRLVTNLHKKVPYTRCIGWDVTVDHKQSVRIMEWNAKHNDIKFTEATQGPCFSDLHWERLKELTSAPF